MCLSHFIYEVCMYIHTCAFMCVRAHECVLYAVWHRNWLAWVCMCPIVAALALKFIQKVSVCYDFQNALHS